MADEFNQPDSSQSANAVEPNGAGKPAEAASQPTMTPSQSNDYNIKTQQLAQERREHEARVQAFEQERQQFSQQYGQNNNSYGNGYGVPNQGQPNQQPYQGQPSYPQPNGYAQPPVHQMPVPQETYSQLVKEFGVEGADAQLRLIQQTTAPILREFNQAKQELDNIKINSLRDQIRVRGRETYGKDWAEKESAVLKHIESTGHDLDYAWYKVNGAKTLTQAGVDKAYEVQQLKEQANVHQGQVQPASGSGAGEFNTVEDAFNAAWKQHA